MTQTHPMLLYVFGKKETVSNSSLTTLQCDLQSHIQLPKLIRRKVTIIDLYIWPEVLSYSKTIKVAFGLKHLKSRGLTKKNTN